MRAFTKPIALCVGGALLTVSGLAFAEREVVDRIAAVIEDDIITVRELEEKAEQYLPQLEEIKDPEQRAERRGRQRPDEAPEADSAYAPGRAH